VQINGCPPDIVLPKSAEGLLTTSEVHVQSYETKLQSASIWLKIGAIRLLVEAFLTKYPTKYVKLFIGYKNISIHIN